MSEEEEAWGAEVRGQGTVSATCGKRGIRGGVPTGGKRGAGNGVPDQREARGQGRRPRPVGSKGAEAASLTCEKRRDRAGVPDWWGARGQRQRPRPAESERAGGGVPLGSEAAAARRRRLKETHHSSAQGGRTRRARLPPSCTTPLSQGAGRGRIQTLRAETWLLGRQTLGLMRSVAISANRPQAKPQQRTPLLPPSLLAARSEGQGARGGGDRAADFGESAPWR